jgi:hypothetical protein
MARRRKAPRTPVTVLVRVHARCREGMHLWCPGTIGRRRPQACLCPCHKGETSKLRVAR